MTNDERCSRCGGPLGEGFTVSVFMDEREVTCSACTMDTAGKNLLDAMKALSEMRGEDGEPLMGDSDKDR